MLVEAILRIFYQGSLGPFLATERASMSNEREYCSKVMCQSQDFIIILTKKEKIDDNNLPSAPYVPSSQKQTCNHTRHNFVKYEAMAPSPLSSSSQIPPQSSFRFFSSRLQSCPSLSPYNAHDTTTESEVAELGKEFQVGQGFGNHYHLPQELHYCNQVVLQRNPQH